MSLDGKDQLTRLSSLCLSQKLGWMTAEQILLFFPLPKRDLNGKDQSTKLSSFAQVINLDV